MILTFCAFLRSLPPLKFCVIFLGIHKSSVASQGSYTNSLQHRTCINHKQYLTISVLFCLDFTDEFCVWPPLNIPQQFQFVFRQTVLSYFLKFEGKYGTALNQNMEIKG
jgi:hypothetical protein